MPYYDFAWVMDIFNMFWDTFAIFTTWLNRDIFLSIESFLDEYLNISVDIPLEFSIGQMFNGPFLYGLIVCAIVAFFVRTLLVVIEQFT